MIQELPKTFDYPRLCKAVDDLIKASNAHEIKLDVLENRIQRLKNRIAGFENALEELHDKVYDNDPGEE